MTHPGVREPARPSRSGRGTRLRSRGLEPESREPVQMARWSALGQVGLPLRLQQISIGKPHQNRVGDPDRSPTSRLNSYP